MQRAGALRRQAASESSTVMLILEDGLDRILIGVAVKYKGILVFLKHRQL